MAAGSRDIEKQLGVVIKGSLSEGVEMRLNPERSVEEIRAGKFVVIQGQNKQFFSMITDVKLEATNQQVLADPPGESDPLMQEILTGSMTYGVVELRPMLMTGEGETPSLYACSEEPQPVKTIPSHFSPVYEADEADVSRIFGGEDKDKKFFNIGAPLDMDTPVCMNLNRFVERSNGIFGKTGTGKSFLTRLMLCGIIQRDEAVCLVFDMHNEYGWKARVEGGGAEAKGLHQLFGSSKVAVFTLDPESSRKRGVPYDYEIQIPRSKIEIEDVALLQWELNLNPTAVEASYLIFDRYKDRWLSVLLDQDSSELKDFAEAIGAHPGSISALYRKLRMLERLPFLKEKVVDDAVKRIMEYLEDGRHVIIEFGQQSQLLNYMLVANILTREVHRLYVHKTEMALGDSTKEPKPLVITVEEAHKFLSPSVAQQTTFGAIAREMRKYSVTLLIVDQRPSGIHDEVLSQIGTKIVALLDDEQDINAVFTGVSGAQTLKGVLATLDTKQQALILGHAVPMPVVVRVRDYDNDFYRAMGHIFGEELAIQAEKDTADIFGV